MCFVSTRHSQKYFLKGLRMWEEYSLRTSQHFFLSAMQFFSARAQSSISARTAIFFPVVFIDCNVASAQAGIWIRVIRIIEDGDWPMRCTCIRLFADGMRRAQTGCCSRDIHFYTDDRCCRALFACVLRKHPRSMERLFSPRLHWSNACASEFNDQSSL